MEISCDMAMDLITLYHDGLLSESSVRAIKAHLKGCPNCRRAYREYKLAEIHPAATQTDVSLQELNDRFSFLARRLRKRQYLITGGMGLYILLTLLLLIFYLQKERDEA
ncbi:MAG: zf-HC2 domain-containing protein [Negativicutes bacterium]|nr:zf-HC2 domain-containing protein [Negativicutes bacterium]